MFNCDIIVSFLDVTINRGSCFCSTRNKFLFVFSISVTPVKLYSLLKNMIFKNLQLVLCALKYHHLVVMFHKIPRVNSTVNVCGFVVVPRVSATHQSNVFCNAPSTAPTTMLPCGFIIASTATGSTETKGSLNTDLIVSL